MLFILHFCPPTSIIMHNDCHGFLQLIPLGMEGTTRRGASIKRGPTTFPCCGSKKGKCLLDISISFPDERLGFSPKRKLIKIKVLGLNIKNGQILILQKYPIWSRISLLTLPPEFSEFYKKKFFSLYRCICMYVYILTNHE